MTTPLSPTPSAGAPVDHSTWTIRVLTVWHPAIGLAIDPVAVLAIDTAAGADPAQVVVWVPETHKAAAPWRERLAGRVSLEQVAVWDREDGVCQVAEAAVPEGSLDLRHAAELVLDELLAEVIPSLPPRPGE
ncbi:hypothetical protein BIV57_13495 [Mangrovactinospora gilvigrisea]|uniref:Uncharacterized protein n=1 Tax=Mangrovactinospora gilvigrisea TaxID=1428644 RepID=A0A1J7BEJ6_9ACTN|nr:hypothetical protein [Mangrovactinospora gilvigrisea]OIV36997.1 hypothetical protein BIV57_13495 [Mangrovactinospora gilvigrisea]